MKNRLLRIAAKEIPADGTARMAAWLKRLAQEADPALIEYGANDRRVEMLRTRLQQVTEWKLRMPLKFVLARELLGDGRNEEALTCLDEIQRRVAQHGLAMTPADRQAVRMQRVLAEMRIGETDNCCSEHNADSCLLPLRGDAIYRHQDAPRKAIELLKDQLAEVPGDLTARWLLNIAHMTLGEYPASVPPQ